jgi:hypothetical protein
LDIVEGNMNMNIYSLGARSRNTATLASTGRHFSVVSSSSGATEARSEV